MEAFLSLSCMFIFLCILPLAFVAGLIYLLVRFTKPQDNKIKKSLLLSWLKDKKEQGFSTIDQLVKLLETPIEPIKQETILSTTQDSQDTSIQTTNPPTHINKPSTTPTKPKQNLFDKVNASVLLYVGSFLVLFSIFIFVAFNWQNYSNLIKSIFLVLFTLFFYTLGILLKNIKSLKSAGITFLTIASILFGFLGIGLWRFGLEQSLSINFSTYWLIYSSVMVCVFSLTTFLLGKKRFFYLLLAGIYSAIISLAFVLTKDEKFRILVIATLNLLFYLSSLVFGKYTNIVKVSTRIINLIMDFLIIGNVALYFDEIQTDRLEPVAIIGLSIPIIFSIATLFLEKYKIEFSVSILIFPIKLFLFTSLYLLGAEITMIFWILYILILTLSCLTFFSGKNQLLLYWISKISIWLNILFMTQILLIAPRDDLSVVTFVYLFTACFISLLLEIMYKIATSQIAEKYNLDLILGMIFINYPIVTILKLIHIILPNAEIWHYLFATTFIYIISYLALLFFKKFRKLQFQYLFAPLIFTSLATSILLSLFGNSEYILYIFSLATILNVVLIYIYKFPFLKYINIFFYLITTLSFVHNIGKHFEWITTSGHQSFLLLFIAFIFLAIFDINEKMKKVDYSYLLGSVFFTIFANGFAFPFQLTFLIVSNIILLYLSYTLLRFKKVFLPYLFYAQAIVSYIALIRYFDLNLEHSLLIASVSNLFLSILCLIKFKTPELNQITKHLRYLTIGSITISALTVFLLIQFENSYLNSITGLLIFITLLVSGKSNKIFAELSGTGLLLSIWNIGFIQNLNINFFTVPLCLYLLVLALVYKNKKPTYASYFFEISCYLIQLSTLLILSLTESDFQKILYGLILIVLSLGILIMALARKKAILIWMTLGFVFLELIIQFYQTILLIPWWMYLCLFGIAIISLAVYILWKVGKKPEPTL